MEKLEMSDSVKQAAADFVAAVKRQMYADPECGVRLDAARVEIDIEDDEMLSVFIEFS